MPDTAANAYLRSKVMTARPEELRLMLHDAALRFARQGRDALGRKDFESVYESLKNAKSILLEFTSTLDHARQPDLCEKLTALYTYMYTRLVDAGVEKDPAIIDEVITLLEYDRETWVMLMDQLAEDRKQGVADAQPASSAEPPSDIGATLSIEG
ncbi:MAG: flagellar export chaperone FliS [Phycisphaerales bacterium]|nr:flagellar export chaperone FliS [Phycisphaerales bacterium]